MSILRKAGTAAATSIAGAGIAIGGVGLATASDSTSGQDSTTQTTPYTSDGSVTSSAMPGGGRGPGAGDWGGSDKLAAGLAEALGLETSDVSAALKTVRDQLKPEESAKGETRPTEAEREARQGEMASALADELGVSEQKVTDAFASMTGDQTTEARSGLADRLDTAVDDGDLTESDKRAVLKAFDAGVLGGEQRGHWGAGKAAEGAVNS